MITELIRNIGSLFRWFIVVAPWEQALRVRAGRHVRLLTAGIYLRVPLIDRVYRQSTRRRLSIIRPQTLTTHDGRTLTLGSAFSYEILDLLRLYETIHDADDTIESEISALISSAVSNLELRQCTPRGIEEAVRRDMDLTRYGLGGAGFYITNFATVRTLRLITGEIPAWQRGGGINTNTEDSQLGNK